MRKWPAKALGCRRERAIEACNVFSEQPSDFLNFDHSAINPKSSLKVGIPHTRKKRGSKPRGILQQWFWIWFCQTRIYMSPTDHTHARRPGESRLDSSRPYRAPAYIDILVLCLSRRPRARRARLDTPAPRARAVASDDARPHQHPAAGLHTTTRHRMVAATVACNNPRIPCAIWPSMPIPLERYDAHAAEA